MISRLLRASIDLVYPAICICGGTAAMGGWCDECLRLTPPTPSPLCVVCGLPFTSGGADHPCGRCIRNRPAFRQARACAAYDSVTRRPQPLRDAIHRHKYGRHLWLGRPLGELMSQRLAQTTAYDILTAVPLHIERLRWRGFNQSVLLARRLARSHQLPVLPSVIERCAATQAQVGLSSEDRRANVRGAFRVKQPALVCGKRVLLIDDVMTTGATVDECARVLRRAGASYVDVFVLARAIV